jgi:hypothetical protein
MRVAASVVLAGLIALGASGCEFVSPQDTTQIDQVSDGINAKVGPVDILNALLITVDGRNASLVTTLVNTSTSARTVHLQYTGTSSAGTSGPVTQRVPVPANGSVSIRPGGQATVTLRNVKVELGGLFPVQFFLGSDPNSGTAVQVPVLDNRLPGYQTLAPSPSPTPTPTLTPTPGATPTGAATSGATPTPSATPTP